MLIHKLAEARKWKVRTSKREPLGRKIIEAKISALDEYSMGEGSLEKLDSNTCFNYLLIRMKRGKKSKCFKASIIGLEKLLNKL